MGKLVKATLIATCLSVSMAVWSATAHESSTGDVRLLHPWAMPAKAGANTRLYMVIENDESENITLMSLETSVAQSAQFRFQADAKTVLPLSSRSVMSEEALNVGSHHMWFELMGLRRDLVEGGEFPAKLSLADGRIINLTVAVGRSIKADGSDG